MYSPTHKNEESRNLESMLCDTDEIGFGEELGCLERPFHHSALWDQRGETEQLGSRRGIAFLLPTLH